VTGHSDLHISIGTDMTYKTSTLYLF
jgi:hypothetical protein